MSEKGLVRASAFYIRHVGKIGALYCIVPAVAWFVIMMAKVPFRNVYALRLGISVVVGGLIAAAVNRFAVTLWLARHRSPQGPGGLLGDAIIGAGSGIGSCFLAPLTSFIASNHMEEAKTLVISAWIVAAVIGAFIGAILGGIGRGNVAREWPSEGEEAR